MKKNSLKIIILASILGLSSCSLSKENIVNNGKIYGLTSTPTPRPTNTPTSRPTSTPTPRPTSTSTPRPTNTPTPIPTSTPTPIPTSTPTPLPTLKPYIVKIPVDFIAQYPEFPTGCESVSAVMVLRYKGFNITPAMFIDNYLPKINDFDEYYTGDNENKDLVFYHYFVGNPRREDGRNCYASVIKKAIDEYFNEIGETNLKCYDLTGVEFDNLYEELEDGNPIILWISMNLKEPKEWYIYDKMYHRPNHTVVLTGYNEEENVVYINDPLKGEVEYDTGKVKIIYNKMGQRAAVIK